MRAILRRRALAVLAVLALPVQPAPAQATPPAEAVAAIEQAVEAERTRLGIPGLSLAVAWGSEVALSRGFGLADVENAVVARPETVYRLASVSKPLTAAAVLQLAERHKLDLDAGVSIYVPTWPRKRWPITLRQLLSHTGGIRGYREGEMTSMRAYRDLEEGLGIFRNEPLAYEPGTRYLYTTYGYSLLGRAAEAAAGLRFEELLRQGVFEPAGMASTRADEPAPLIPHRARGYRKLPTGELANSPYTDTSYKVPGGGLLGTAEDLARFALALWRGALLQPATLEQMFTPSHLRDGRQLGYALGWSVTRRGEWREAWHPGNQPSVTTVLLVQPERKVAVAILCNLEEISAALTALARQVADLVPTPPAAPPEPTHP